MKKFILVNILLNIIPLSVIFSNYGNGDTAGAVLLQLNTTAQALTNETNRAIGRENSIGVSTGSIMSRVDNVGVSTGNINTNFVNYQTDVKGSTDNIITIIQSTMATVTSTYLNKTTTDTAQGIIVNGNIGTFGNISSSGSASNYFAGNVGIGVTNPLATLHLRESISANLRMDAAIGQGHGIFLRNPTYNVWQIQRDGNNNLSFYDYLGTPGTRLYLQSVTGNIGIGTMTPDNKLNVIGNISASGLIVSSGGAVLGDSQLDNLIINAGSVTYSQPYGLYFSTTNTNNFAPALFLTNYNNVGLGTISPTAGEAFHSVTRASGAGAVIENTASTVQLTVKTSAANSFAYLTMIGRSNTNDVIYMGDQDAQDRGRIQYGNPSDNLSLWTAGSQWVNISSVGNVGIGTTSPTSNSKLEISTTSTAGFSINFVGAVDSLPTSGYNRFTFCGLTTDNKIYVASETIKSVDSWKPLW